MLARRRIAAVKELGRSLLAFETGGVGWIYSNEQSVAALCCRLSYLYRRARSLVRPCFRSCSAFSLSCVAFRLYPFRDTARPLVLCWLPSGLSAGLLLVPRRSGLCLALIRATRDGLAPSRGRGDAWWKGAHDPVHGPRMSQNGRKDGTKECQRRSVEADAGDDDGRARRCGAVKVGDDAGVYLQSLCGGAVGLEYRCDQI